MRLTRYRAIVAGIFIFVGCGFCLFPHQALCKNPTSPSSKSTTPANDISAIDSSKDRSRERAQAVILYSSEQILEKVDARYSKCHSYKDSGNSVTEVTMQDGSKGILSQTAFLTTLRKGKFTLKYRFAYRVSYFEESYGKATILWHDGQRTMTSNTVPSNFVEEESLRSGVAGLTSLSSGAAHNIPALLMPKLVAGRKITELTNLKPPLKEKIGDAICYRLNGLYGNLKVSLWVEKDSFLILKISEYRNRNRNEEPSTRTTLFTPEMAIKISDRFFEKQVGGEWKHLSP